jgi:hypothetical protein
MAGFKGVETGQSTGFHQKGEFLQSQVTLSGNRHSACDCRRVRKQPPTMNCARVPTLSNFKRDKVDRKVTSIVFDDHPAIARLPCCSCAALRAPKRFASLRSGRIVWFSSRHAFQVVFESLNCGVVVNLFGPKSFRPEPKKIKRRRKTIIQYIHR